MRDKEVLQDYRFMPEPNLPPLCLNTSTTVTSCSEVISVALISKGIPELPEDTRSNLIKKYHLSQDVAVILVVSWWCITYFFSM